MGQVLADITVKNAEDIALLRKGHITEKDVRTVMLNAVVDTGATTLVINEEILDQLGLTILKTSPINVAGGSIIECKVTSPVNIHWKDRFAVVSAVVLPKGQPLLGVIPLEFMDLVVDPIRRELVGAHGDKTVFMAL